MLIMKKKMIAVLLICVTSVFALDNNYIGSNDGAFSEASNWDTSSVPNSAHNVIVDNGNNVIVTAYAEMLSLKLGQYNQGNSSMTITNGAGVPFGATVYAGSSIADSNSVGTLALDNGHMGSVDLIVGYGGTGYVNLFSGTMTISGTIALGGDVNAATNKGGYLMAHNGYIKANAMVIHPKGGTHIVNAVYQINTGAKDLYRYINEGLIVTNNGWEIKTEEYGQGGLTIYAKPISEVKYYSPSDGFSKTDKVVSSSLFTWHDTAGTWQTDGPWLPYGGIESWTGQIPWWENMIKEAMYANIDVLWVHFWNEEPLRNFFSACSKLRAEGYNIPKIAPIVDFHILSLIVGGFDMSQTYSKDRFVDYYIDFFNQYFSRNTDDYASDYLAKIDGKIVLVMYTHDGTPSTDIVNMSSLTRADVESRLAAALAEQYPDFNNGIYMIRPKSSDTLTPSWSDEKTPLFEIAKHYEKNTYGSGDDLVISGHVSPGFWPVNIRPQGVSGSGYRILKRNGGSNYLTAWDSLIADGSIMRAYVESFNEYDEGSGIFVCDVANSPDVTVPCSDTDTWSSTNDPFEYLKTTAIKASQFKNTPGLKAEYVYNNIPTTMRVGESRVVKVVVRNDGTELWSPSGYSLGQPEWFGTPFGPARVAMDGLRNGIQFYGGIFNGRTVEFNFTITAPSTPGSYTAYWAMIHEWIAWSTELLEVNIEVTDCPYTDLTDDCMVNFEDFAIFAQNWISE